MNVSSYLCRKIDDLKELSMEDKEQLRMLLLDFFAAVCAGYKQNSEFNASVEEVILSQGGQPEASVFLKQNKYPARSAAFINAMYCHGAELDDGNKKAMGHIGTHIIPAVFALAEAEKKCEDEILLAIASGYEVYIRISSAAQPGMVNRGFHSTGMAGAPACAVACAKLLGLNAEEIENAMALACTMASGLLTYSESRQQIKPINPAKAADTGVFAARLAQNGIKGPLNCLEGPHGWFKAVTNNVNEDMLLEKNGGRLLIHDCYFKLYPSCRHTHCGIEAALKLHNKVDVSKIKQIQVYIYPNAIELAGQIAFPQNADETKFSIHYTLACALLYGEYGVEYMNPPKTGESLIKIIEKIVLIPDESLENKKKGIRGTKVIIILENGETICESVSVPKGDPENPLKKKDIIEKLSVCSKGLVDKKRIEQLIRYLDDFGQHIEINPKLLFNGMGR